MGDVVPYNGSPRSDHRLGWASSPPTRWARASLGATSPYLRSSAINHSLGTTLLPPAMCPRRQQLVSLAQASDSDHRLGRTPPPRPPSRWTCADGNCIPCRRFSGTRGALVADNSPLWWGPTNQGDRESSQPAVATGRALVEDAIPIAAGPTS